MKSVLLIPFIAISGASFAQMTSAPDTTAPKKDTRPPVSTINPVNTNINVGPGVTTTLNSNQPMNIASGNTKPTTGTIIPMTRSKDAGKAVNPLGTETLERPVVSRNDTIITKTNKVQHKKRRKKY